MKTGVRQCLFRIIKRFKNKNMGPHLEICKISFHSCFKLPSFKMAPILAAIVTSWPSIDIQLLLQQKCYDNSLLSSIWPLSGPLLSLIWALVSTNTLTMTKRMRGTSKTVRSVHTEQTYDHTVHTEQTFVH